RQYESPNCAWDHVRNRSLRRPRSADSLSLVCACAPPRAAEFPHLGGPAGALAADDTAGKATGNDQRTIIIQRAKMGSRPPRTRASGVTRIRDRSRLRLCTVRKSRSQVTLA